jgi:hypothetical protein
LQNRLLRDIGSDINLIICGDNIQCTYEIGNSCWRRRRSRRRQYCRTTRWDIGWLCSWMNGRKPCWLICISWKCRIRSYRSSTGFRRRLIRWFSTGNPRWLTAWLTCWLMRRLHRRLASGLTSGLASGLPTGLP